MADTATPATSQTAVAAAPSTAVSTGPSESGTNNNNNVANPAAADYSRSTVGKGKRSVGRST
uniref:Uncharacterized protein n=1 Tax=Panagrolaimus sp. ES5 TaxID=591445 RepID=A0AC34FNS6_9BILA